MGNAPPTSDALRPTDMDPVARRYAQALTEEAQATDQLEAVDADVAVLTDALAGSRELRQLLGSPVVSRAKKEAVLTRLLDGHVGDLTARFVHLLVSKQREGDLADVLAAYSALRDERTGTVEARVHTAKPLSADEAERLKAALEAQAGAAVRMDLVVDPSLIGGMVVRVGDVVYDQSVKHQLETLRGQLIERAAVSLN